MNVEKRFSKLTRRLELMERLLQDTRRDLDCLRGENSFKGRKLVELTGREKWVLQKIEEQGHPIFRCDIVRPQDVLDALVWIDPNVKREMSLHQVGRILARIGRYAKRTVSENQRNHRVWILRHMDTYLTWASGELWREYEKQMRDNVPPGYRFGDDTPVVNPRPDPAPSATVDFF